MQTPKGREFDFGSGGEVRLHLLGRHAQTTLVQEKEGFRKIVQRVLLK